MAKKIDLKLRCNTAEIDFKTQRIEINGIELSELIANLKDEIETQSIINAVCSDEDLFDYINENYSVYDILNKLHERDADGLSDHIEDFCDELSDDSIGELTTD